MFFSTISGCSFLTCKYYNLFSRFMSSKTLPHLWQTAQSYQNTCIALRQCQRELYNIPWGTFGCERSPWEPQWESHQPQWVKSDLNQSSLLGLIHPPCSITTALHPLPPCSIPSPPSPSPVGQPALEGLLTTAAACLDLGLHCPVRYMQELNRFGLKVNQCGIIISEHTHTHTHFEVNADGCNV